jgi:cyclohexadienyl dehydratase
MPSGKLSDNVRGTCFSLLLVLVAGSAGAASARPDAGELISQRLALMQDVAAFKWANGLPIEDLERERIVLEAAVRSGLDHGLTATSVESFFALQIKAAKEIQRYWFDRWGRDDDAPPAPDLATTIRPQIVELGDAILAAAPDHRLLREIETGDDGKPRSPGDAARAYVEALPEIARIAGLSEDTRRGLADAYLALSRYPDRLTQILDAGVLRVGTTGDYLPFSWRDADGFHGVDIEMAEDLAAMLGVRLELITTSWPTLMSDLGSGRYDLAMSGVSKTAEREAVAFLSAPYYQGGKTAISRCDEAARFASLKMIDQPGVRVVVNPGGTNERFVDAHIRQASKLLHPDNRTIFAEIVAGRADVMITDAIEVTLQARDSEDLCRSVAGLLNHQQKAYVLPKDVKLLKIINRWLDQRLTDGSVAQRFAEYGISVES